MLFAWEQQNEQNCGQRIVESAENIFAILKIYETLLTSYGGGGYKIEKNGFVFFKTDTRRVKIKRKREKSCEKRAYDWPVQHLRCA